MNETIVQEAADAAAKRLRSGGDFTDAVRAALRGRGISKEMWPEYFAAVASELGRRSREMRPPKRAPEQPAGEATQAQPHAKDKQLGFEFGKTEHEAPRRRAA